MMTCFGLSLLSGLISFKFPQTAVGNSTCFSSGQAAYQVSINRVGAQELVGLGCRRLVEADDLGNLAQAPGKKLAEQQVTSGQWGCKADLTFARTGS